MRGAAVIVVLVLSACTRDKRASVTRDDPPDTGPALSPEARLAAILTKYSRSTFDSDPKLPGPDDPWNGRRMRLAGRVDASSPIDRSVTIVAPGVQSTTSVWCQLPVGAKPLLVGTFATLQGKLRIRTEFPMTGEFRVSLTLGDCTLVQGSPRLFRTTAAALGVELVSIDTLLTGPQIASGTRVGFRARVRWNGPGLLYLYALRYTKVVVCRGTPSALALIKEEETLPFAARVVPGTYAGANVNFDDCQPLDDG